MLGILKLILLYLQIVLNFARFAIFLPYFASCARSPVCMYTRARVPKTVIKLSSKALTDCKRAAILYHVNSKFILSKFEYAKSNKVKHQNEGIN